jgi:hypothetical protein
VWWYTATQEAKAGALQSKAGQSKSMRPYLKNKKQKKDWGLEGCYSSGRVLLA